jgi:LysM repeat protein
MKILKIFGIVIGIHVFALLLIFANPGCSTARKPAPVPADTAVKDAPAAETVAAPIPPPVPGPAAAPVADSAPVLPAAAPAAPAPATPPLFDPNTPAAAASADSSTGVRFMPTRPGTPVAGALQAEKVADVTPASTYIVRPGDSLWSIAKKHKLTVGDLTAANGIAANANLQPGKKLVIPAKSGAVAASAPAPAAPAPAKPARPAKAAVPRSGVDGVRHVVKPGESLSVIARNYGVRQSEIALANGISDPTRLQAGTEIVIPGVTAPKAAKAPETKPGDAAAPPPAPPVIPVIRIEESPVTPAPKP